MSEAKTPSTPVTAVVAPPPPKRTQAQSPCPTLSAGAPAPR
jgi:hypothetical protein